MIFSLLNTLKASLIISAYKAYDIAIVCATSANEICML